MQKSRVVVTGMGAITPIGLTVEEFWENVKAQKVGIGAITKFDTTDFKVKLAAEVKGFDAQAYMLEQSWNASHVLWACSRNFGKSFVGSVFILLKAILYENQGIYIVSSVGDQSKVSCLTYTEMCVCFLVNCR